MSSKRPTGLRRLLTLPRHRRADMWASVYRGAFHADDGERQTEARSDDD